MKKLKKKKVAIYIFCTVSLCALGTGCNSNGKVETITCDTQGSETVTESKNGYTLVTPEENTEKNIEETDDYYKYTRLEEHINKITKETQP